MSQPASIVGSDARASERQEARRCNQSFPHRSPPFRRRTSDCPRRNHQELHRAPAQFAVSTAHSSHTADWFSGAVGGSSRAVGPSTGAVGSFSRAAGAFSRIPESSSRADESSSRTSKVSSRVAWSSDRAVKSFSRAAKPSSRTSKSSSRTDKWSSRAEKTSSRARMRQELPIWAFFHQDTSLRDAFWTAVASAARHRFWGPASPAEKRRGAALATAVQNASRQFHAATHAGQPAFPSFP